MYVAEDFAFSRPLVANDTIVRALGRGSQFYRSYRWSALFCPQCSSGGRSHSKRYSTNYESKFPSYLSWRLSHDHWVPTSVWGEPPTATSPRDAWYEEERPEEARMQQSWMRYLPVATPALGADLASLAGVRRVAEADARGSAGCSGHLRRGLRTARSIQTGALGASPAKPSWACTGASMSACLYSIPSAAGSSSMTFESLPPSVERLSTACRLMRAPMTGRSSG